MQNINDEYPIYAFRNISLEQWKSGDLWDLEGHHLDYMRSKKNQRLKYKMQHSDKVIPMVNRFNYEYRWRKYPDDEKNLKRKYMKELIKEELFNFKNNTDDIFCCTW